MIPYELIARKRDGGRHPQEELESLVGGLVLGKIGETEMAAWLMAAFIRGLDPEETVGLTKAMISSGSVIDLGGLTGPVVDKHSTGGVGDKTTLVVGPLAAAAGLKVPKLSGKALGHTGGTLDKLSAIPGMRTRLSRSEFLAQLDAVGVAVAAQTEDMVPADKLIYALRDRTATVESIPLITSSILSKKAAGGAKNILIDVKVGTGAFMPTLDRAEELGRSLETVGASLGLNVNCLITDMNQPLGRAVGNSLEVCEAIDTLAGNGPEDLLELSVRLAAEMVLMAGLEDDLETARARVERALMSGDGLKVLREMIEAQDGDPRVIDDRGLLPTATHSYKLTAQSDGFVTFQNCRAVGMAAAVLGGHKGGGRPNPGAGLLVDVRHGDQVNSGAPLVEILYDDEAQRGEAEVLLRRAIAVSPDRPKPWPLIYDRLPARSD